MRQITHLVVHCSATRAGQDIGAKTIRKWHMDKGWLDIGYHFVIRLNGKIEVGRPLEQPGSHVQGHNKLTVGICLIGGLDADTGKPANTFTPEQFESLHSLLHDLKSRWRKATVLGHRDMSPDKNNDGKITRNEWLKDCPCFDVPEWWNGGHGVKGNAL